MIGGGVGGNRYDRVLGLIGNCGDEGEDRTLPIRWGG